MAVINPTEVAPPTPLISPSSQPPKPQEPLPSPAPRSPHDRSLSDPTPRPQQIASVVPDQCPIDDPLQPSPVTVPQPEATPQPSPAIVPQSEATLQPSPVIVPQSEATLQPSPVTVPQPEATDVGESSSVPPATPPPSPHSDSPGPEAADPTLPAISPIVDHNHPEHAPPPVGTFTFVGTSPFITPATIQYLQTVPASQRWVEMVAAYLRFEALPIMKGVRISLVPDLLYPVLITQPVGRSPSYRVPASRGVCMDEGSDLHGGSNPLYRRRQFIPQ